MDALIDPVFNILDQRNVFAYPAALLFLVVFVVALRLLRPRPSLRLRAVLRLMFRKSVWLHRSARLDYKMFLVSFPLIALVFGLFIIGLDFWTQLFGSGLVAAFGPATTVANAGWAILALAVLIQLLSFDLGYWIGHAALHKSAILWEFHKVHHSAEVLTPMTEYRQHPLEFILVPTTTWLTMGLSSAAIAHWLGAEALTTGNWGLALIIVVHTFTIYHLRHTHLNMPFTGVLGRLLQSPGHHRIHHSNNPIHFDCNMGYMLSFWDWVFGTLYVPRPNEPVTLGIGHDGECMDSVANAFWLPVRNAGALIARRLQATRIARLGN